MEERTKLKMIALTSVVMYAICFVSVFLYVPIIITSIVEHMHPTYDETKVTSRASTLKSFSDGANALVALFCVPILGSMSDVFGRKRIMLLGAIAEIFYLACLLGAYSFSWLWLIYFASIFHIGMAVHLGAIAFMSDISLTEAEKAKNFGHVMGAFMGGIIIGNILLGLLGRENLQLSFFFLLCWAMMLVLFLVFAFKESPTFFQNEKREKTFDIKKGNPFQAMKLIFATSPYIALLGLIYALNFLSLSDISSSSYLYTQYRYGWGSLGNGLSSAFRGLVAVFWQAIGVILLLKVIPRHYILTAAMFLAACIHITQGVTSKAWVYFSATVVGGFASIGFPLLQSFVSDAVPREKQGLALGGLSSVMSIAMLIGALISENLFALCLIGDGYFSCPGTAFYFSAITLVLAGFISLCLFKKYPPVTRNDSILLSSDSSTSLSKDFHEQHNNNKEIELMDLSSIHIPEDKEGSAKL